MSLWCFCGIVRAFALNGLNVLFSRIRTPKPTKSLKDTSSLSLFSSSSKGCARVELPSFIIIFGSCKSLWHSTNSLLSNCLAISNKILCSFGVASGNLQRFSYFWISLCIVMRGIFRILSYFMAWSFFICATTSRKNFSFISLNSALLNSLKKSLIFIPLE